MPSVPRSFPPDEPLYRILEPEFWDETTGLIYPQAFLDEGTGYERLSVYLGRKANPRRVLDIFSKLRGIRREFNDPTPESLWNQGYGIGRITVQDMTDLGLDFEREPGGAAKYKSNWHVNIPGGQKHAADLARRAAALKRSEIFG
jgi:hypothetical protein